MTEYLSVPILADMERKKYVYTPVDLPDEIRERVKELAKEHRRSIAQEGGKLLERGLDDYEKQVEPEPGA